MKIAAIIAIIFAILLLIWGTITIDEALDQIREAMETVDQPPAKIIVDNELTAVWMAVNNSYADGGDSELNDKGKPVYTRMYWNGVLFQVGDPELDEPGEDFDVEYTQIVIDGAAGLHEEYGLDEFYWVNVFSTELPNPTLDSDDYVTAEPLDVSPASNQPFYLYSSADELGSAHCRQDPACACACDGDFARRLHAQFEVKAMITYWHGINGYDVNVRQMASVREHNRYEFDLNDAVDVNVYKAVTTAADGLTMELVDSLVGVHTIRVMNDGSSDHGKHVEPPYP